MMSQLIKLKNGKILAFINDILIPEDGSSCDDSDQYYTNFDKRKIMGLELNSTFYSTHKLAIKLTASRILKATEENGSMPLDVIAKGGHCNSLPYSSDKEDIKLLSKYMYSVLASYQFNSFFSGSVNLQYAAARKTPANYHANVNTQLKLNSTDNQDSYYLVDVFGNFSINEHLSLELSIRNLFDETVYHPRLSDVEDYDVQLPDRRYELKLKYQF